MDEKKFYKTPEEEDRVDVLEDPAVAVSYGGNVVRRRKVERTGRVEVEEKVMKEGVVDERELVSEEAWNSRPAVYTDEELADILREREKSVNWVSNDSVMEICAKLGYV